MADKCAYCRGADVQHGTDTYMCLSCGNHTAYDGQPASPPKVVHLAPNIGDLQRRNEPRVIAPEVVYTSYSDTEDGAGAEG